MKTEEIIRAMRLKRNLDRLKVMGGLTAIVTTLAGIAAVISSLMWWEPIDYVFGMICSLGVTVIAILQLPDYFMQKRLDKLKTEILIDTFVVDAEDSKKEATGDN